MKKITWIFFSFFAFISANAQIGIIEGLNSATIPTGWTQVGGFGSTTTTPCEGSHAYRDNLYAFSTTGNFTSPNYVGASNGTDLTVAFQWKATEWSAGDGVGFTVNVEYSADNGTSWIAIGDPILASTVTECADFSSVVPGASLPEGSDFKFRVRETWTSGDCYFWIDNISITQVTALPPNCDAALTSPVDGSAEVNLTGVLSWSPATGLPSSYILSVGTTSGGTDVVANLDLGLATSYDIPGLLAEQTTYYVTITPTNANGNATGCTVYSFTTGTALPGDFCSNAIDLTNETSPLQSTTVGATNDNLIVCNNSNEEVANIYGDLYYSIVVPDGSMLTIGQTVNSYDSANVVFYGDCDNRTSIRCFDDGDLDLVEWLNDTGASQTVYWVQDGWSGTGTFTLAWSVIACTPAQATYTVVSDCENGEQFLVDVEVTDMGSATSITVSDNQGSAPQTVTATGITTFGPYPNATSVVFTVANDQDADCTLTSPARTQSVCPPNCENAEIITACDEEHTAVFTAGNGSWNVAACGWSTPGVEKLYSFTPAETGAYELEILSVTPSFSYVDYFYKEASGTCDNTGWTCIDDLSTATTKAIGTLTAGVEYLFLIDSEGTTERTHVFKIKCLPTCTNGTSTYTVVSDCENGDQFMVDVNVTSLGTASSVTVSDNQGSEPQTTSATGILTFGPYPNTTGVVFTTANDDDETCVWTSPSTTQSVCPPNCDEATVIAACNEEQTAVFAAGNGAWNVAACGWSTPGVENLYSFTPTETGAYELEIVSVTPNFSYVDYFYKEASGTCDNTGWTCIDDLSTATTKAIGILTAGVEYLFLVDSEGTTARTHVFKIKCLPTCTNGTSTYTVVSDCENGEQFMVDVNVTDFGTATSVTVSDDQGSAPQTVTATGIVTFGPFPNNTPVIFTNANDGDQTCVWTSGVINQIACPPINDECSGAIALTPGASYSDQITDANNSGATGSSQATPATCFGYAGGDIWFSVEVPSSGNLIIETGDSSTSASGIDTVITVYTGSCEELTQVNCNDDNAGTAYSKVTLTGRTPGEVLYIRAYEYGNNNFGEFGISAHDVSLSTSQFDTSGFKVYPNPVKDVLNLTYTQNISKVEVFNMLGQQVLTKSVNATQGQVDMSNLSMGTYLVKVASDNQVKTLKVIKQ
ncbi:T9SS type A sorting domain-containing protein [Flavobacterium sp. PLA-1-15]|uniref:T9SS type A sorting domain-containing protein n=1 Tax=Flavobacterium sp. PLA-1-15 TaxID=3380533 RepID=UPI003B81EBDC